MVRNVLRSFELGFKLAIDDFGTGYSNLRYIRYDIWHNKIDRMFVQNIDSNAENYSLVEYIDMAHKLGIKVCVRVSRPAMSLIVLKHWSRLIVILLWKTDAMG